MRRLGHLHCGVISDRWCREARPVMACSQPSIQRRPDQGGPCCSPTTHHRTSSSAYTTRPDGCTESRQFTGDRLSRLAGAERFERPRTGLEAVMLPLHHAPITPGPSPTFRRERITGESCRNGRNRTCVGPAPKAGGRPLPHIPVVRRGQGIEPCRLEPGPVTIACSSGDRACTDVLWRMKPALCC